MINFSFIKKFKQTLAKINIFVENKKVTKNPNTKKVDNLVSFKRKLLSRNKDVKKIKPKKNEKLIWI